MLTDLLLPIGGYLLGSLSPAWLVGRLHGVDLRQHGSGNLGATNAARVCGGIWFPVVFGSDVIKGMLPVLLVLHLLSGDDSHFGLPLLAVITGLATVLGHSFTCWHRLRGGKAVATSLGVCIGLVPLVAGIAAGIWLLAWLGFQAILRRGRGTAVGPASVVAALAAPTAHLLLADDPWGTALPVSILLIALGLLIVIRHRSNLRQLLYRPPAT